MGGASSPYVDSPASDDIDLIGTSHGNSISVENILYSTREEEGCVCNGVTDANKHGQQKQSGSLQRVLSQGGALLGSVSLSQTFSSEPSLHSFTPLQNNPLAMQEPSPQASSLAF